MKLTMRYVNIFCSSSSVVLCLISSAYCTHTETLHENINFEFAQCFPLPSVCPAGSDLGSEDGLAGLRDHVELLDGGGQVTCRSQVGQTHEATLGPDVVVGPVVPFVRSVRGCRRKIRGKF